MRFAQAYSAPPPPPPKKLRTRLKHHLEARKMKRERERKSEVLGKISPKTRKEGSVCDKANLDDTGYFSVTETRQNVAALMLVNDTDT